MRDPDPGSGLAAWSHLRHQLVHHHTQEDTILFPVAVQLGVEASVVHAATTAASPRVWSRPAT